MKKGKRTPKARHDYAKALREEVAKRGLSLHAHVMVVDDGEFKGVPGNVYVATEPCDIAVREEIAAIERAVLRKIKKQQRAGSK